jgi:hypothetical protein
MPMHPAITAALAEQRRRNLTARAETYPIGPAARPGAASQADHPEPGRGSAATGHAPAAAEGRRNRTSRQRILTQAVKW